MKFKLLPFFILVIFSSCGNNAQSSSPLAPQSLNQKNQRKECVVIVSFDGGKPASIQKAQMPVLSKIVSEGAYTWKAETIFPSLTLPSHTSMITGVEPSVHRFLWNEWREEKGLITIPTIFTLAKNAGMKTALFATKQKFRHFETPNTLDKFTYFDRTSQQIAAEAALYFRNENPNLTFIHFQDADKAGHKYGWESPEQIQALEESDKALGAIVSSIKESKRNCTLIITADHGGTAKGHGSNSADDTNIPWISWGFKVQKTEIQVPIKTTDTAATALHLLGITHPNNWSGRFVKDAFKEE
jgi:predicted AlkP superfamily pyrophosphatase or phosphodiesterase